MLLGVDVGTTGAKAVLIDCSGKIISSSYFNYKKVFYYSNTEIEQCAQEWWEAVVYIVKDCIKDIRDKDSIIAIALSSQGGTMVAVDNKGNPLINAITWMDRRGNLQMRDLLINNDELFYYLKTGWRISPGFNAIQIKWLKDNKKDVFNSTYKFLSTIDFINFKLTGNYCIDPSNAGVTQLSDITNQNWDSDILDLIGINKNNLSEIVSSGESIGNLTIEASLDLGLSKSTAIISGAHDQICESLGAGVINESDLLLSTGTSWVISSVQNKPVFDSNLFFSLERHVIENMWAIVAYTPTGGAAMQWFKNNLGNSILDKSNNLTPESYLEMEKKLGNRKPNNDELIVFPHFMGTSCPTWSIDSRAAIIGLQLNHNRYDIARALMEGVVFDIAWMIEELKCKNLNMKKIKVLGGATNNNIWKKIIADILGADIAVSEFSNISCIGAAIIAGKGTGLFKSMAMGYQALAQKETTVTYNKSNHEIYKNKFLHYKKKFRMING
jgi:xylulokinase